MSFRKRESSLSRLVFLFFVLFPQQNRKQHTLRTKHAKFSRTEFYVSCNANKQMNTMNAETQSLLTNDKKHAQSSSRAAAFASPLKVGLAIAATSATIFAIGTAGRVQVRTQQNRLLGADVTQQRPTQTASNKDAANKVTLTVGCVPKEVLKKLPFDPKDWEGKVGAKFITSNKSPQFKYEDAIEMKEIECGKFQTPYALGNGAKFGFFLYEKANPENYVSDIGGRVAGSASKLIQEEEVAGDYAEEEEAAIGEEAAKPVTTTTTTTAAKPAASKDPVQDGSHIDYAAQANESENLSEKREAEMQALLSQESEMGHAEKKKKTSSSKAKTASVEVVEEVVEEVDASGKKTSKKHSSKKVVVDADAEGDADALKGVEVLGEYFDWGWWMSALSQGTQYQTTDITCQDAICTMQVCEKTKCTEYKKECSTTEQCDDLGDFVKEQTASMGKAGIKKSDANKAYDEAIKASTEVSEYEIKPATVAAASTTSTKSHHRHLLSKHHAVVVAEEGEEEKAKPEPVVVVESKHFKGFGHDAKTKEPAVVVVEEEAPVVVEKSTKKSVKKSSSSSSPSKSTKSSKKKHVSDDVIADVGGDEFSIRHPEHMAARMSSCTTQHVYEEMEFYPRVHGTANHAYIFGGCYNDRDLETCSAPVDVHPAQCVIVKLTDKNFKEAVKACLEEAPIDGKCVEYGKESKFGILPRWDVSGVHNMQEAFADTEFNGYLGSWDTSNVRNMNQMFRGNKVFNGDIRKWSFENLGSATGIFDGSDNYNKKWECGFKATGIIDFSSCQSFQTLKKEKEVQEKMARSHFVTNPEYVESAAAEKKQEEEPVSSATAFDDENAEKYAAEREESFNDQVEEADAAEKAANKNGGGLLQKLFGGGRSPSPHQKVDQQQLEQHSEQQQLDNNDDDDSSTITTAAARDDDYSPTSSDDDGVDPSSLAAATSSSTPRAFVFSSQALTDENFKSEVAKCLSEEPTKGECMESANGPISAWDTSKVTSMYEAFQDYDQFNGDLSHWNTSKVTNMRRMFKGATNFNGACLTKWDVSKVRDMSEMFAQAVVFDGDISNWDVSLCEDMHEMFRDSIAFNQPISKWSVMKSTEQSDIFKGAHAFAQKFECETKHDGPVPSCSLKSETNKKTEDTSSSSSASGLISKIFG